jgi:hypothetical protein
MSTATGGATGTGGASATGGAPGTGGTASTGGTIGTGGASATGGKPGTGGATGSGGTTSTGGSRGSGGAAGAGGITGTGGTTSTGGGPGTGGTPATGGTPGTCDVGTTTTTWATGCATASTAGCVGGTWTDPGSTTNDPLVCQSAHFAVHSPTGTITAAQCTAATDQLENVVWPLYFGSPMYLPEPFCKSATKSKVSVVIHSDYGLTGGCWGNGLPGFWIGPGATADHWGLAHEFMHSVQCSVGTGLNCGSGANTCGWIYESHANWAAQQQPEYHASNVHCSELSANAPHLYAGSTRVRYCDWQFMEYLKDKYCYSAVNSIWLNAPASNDPFNNIMSSRGWNISQLNDFFGEWAMHNVTWDYVDPAPESTAGGNQGTLFRKNYGLITDRSKTDRRIRMVTMDPLDTSYATNRRFVVPDGWAPQRWGYNIVRLYPDSGASSVTVTFRGVVQSAANPDFRWGLVATDTGITTPRYSQIQKGTDGALTFCVNPNESLFLVVVATPSVQQHIVWDQLYNTIYRYPYMVQLANAWPDGWQGGAQAACPSGLVRVANGGGCGPSGLPSTVFVGPYATVLSTATVSGNAQVQDHATVVKGTVTGGTIGALSLVGLTTTPANGFNVSGSATVKTTFMPLGFFESGQSLGGSASLIGDIEFRGVGFTESTGTFYGFVDSTIKAATSTADVTMAGPYSWRN